MFAYMGKKNIHLSSMSSTHAILAVQPLLEEYRHGGEVKHATSNIIQALTDNCLRDWINPKFYLLAIID